LAGEPEYGCTFGVLRAEQRLGAIDRQLFQRIDEVLSFVITLARIALAVLVREHGAGRFQDRLGDVVLRRDQRILSAWRRSSARQSSNTSGSAVFSTSIMAAEASLPGGWESMIFGP
jgi:hypothetical protein